MPERLLHFGRSTSVAGTPCPDAAKDLPPGFEILRYPQEGEAGPLRRMLGAGGRTVILKSRLKSRLLEAGAQDPESLAASPHVAGWLEGGRARHAVIRRNGESWVLKQYRRGGVLGRWNSSRYWVCARFFHELRVASLAEAAGVSTPEVLAIVMERAGLGSVKAWLLTRFLPGVRPLHQCFGDPFESDIFYAAGRIVFQMHSAGIDHPDLHLGNIVGSFDGDGPHAHIVDWDRACCRATGSWNPNGNLVRLWRSVEKGRHVAGKDPGGLARNGRADWSSPPGPPEGAPVFSPPGPPEGAPVFSPPGPPEGAPGPRARSRSLRAFVRGYFSGRPSALREARAYFRRRALFLGMRTLLWRTRR